MNDPSRYPYLPFVAEFYDHIPLYANRPDVGFYVDWARRASGPVLELGSGTGRVLIPTAAAGCRVTGLDSSGPMLAKCLEKLVKQPGEVRQRVRLVESKMTNFGLRETFSLVTAPFRGFQHLLTVEDQLSTLLCVHRHLATGGKFIFDVFQVHPQAIFDSAWTEEREEGPEIALPDGRTLRRTNRVTAFHRAEQYNDIELIHYVTHADGSAERLVYAFPMRYFFRFEIEHLLARCGFHLLELFGDFEGAAFRDDSPDMIFVAEKL
jgi:SAM-dependent methyltransferase